MKNLLRTTVAAATLALIFTAARAEEPDPGYVDVGQIAPPGKGQYVEINLSPALLKFASKVASTQEPDAAALIANLRRIHVHVVGLDDSNRAGAVEKIESIRKSLATQGWTPVVSVREPQKGDNVDIHVKQRSEDVIDGLVITVIDAKGEAVVVNIVGNINADQLGKLAQQLDIEPLKQLHMKLHHKPADKSV